jgi:hypothetical protein
MDGGLNLAARTAALVEGENDPRCLLLAFECVRAAAAAAVAPVAAARRGEFEAEARELFEAGVEPYFPVRFTPRKGDPSAITRRQLADAVAAAMAAAPEFAGLAVPLLSEKLGSNLRCVRHWRRGGVRGGGCGDGGDRRAWPFFVAAGCAEHCQTQSNQSLGTPIWGPR